MEKSSTKVVHLHKRKPREALEHLNRVTGLDFARWPESLLAYYRQDAEREEAELRVEALEA